MIIYKIFLLSMFIIQYLYTYFFSRSYDILSQLRTIWFEKQNWNQNPKAPFHKILQEHYSDRFLDSYQVFEETIWCEKRLRAVPGSTGKCTQSVHLMKTYGCVYTALFKMITNKVLLYSTWNSAQCYVPVGVGEGFGGEWIHVYLWLSPSAVHLKLSQHY